MVAREEWQVANWQDGSLYVFPDEASCRAFAKRMNGSDVAVKRVRYYSKPVSL